MSVAESSNVQLAPLDKDAAGFGALRILPDGRGRFYSYTLFERGWSGADQFLRALKRFGFVRPEGDGYAVLDVVDADGDIVQDYSVPSARAFKYIYRCLSLRVIADEPRPEKEVAR